MEEEANRRDQGQIPESEMDPSWIMKKDAAPSTIYEIFSNNVGTFNPESPSSNQQGDYNPFSPNTSGSAAAQVENGLNNGAAPPQENFYGQGAGEEFDLSAGLPVSNTPDPTMEDVESALAELDSLPDGENNEEEGREDRLEGQTSRDWDYTSSTTETSTQQSETFMQQEVFNNQETVTVVETSSYETEPVVIPQEVSVNNEERNSAGSSPPSSPRFVEGFITSVELNTAQEQLTAGFAAAETVDQQSGPFSVYVSSSPEPASLDPLVNADKVSVDDQIEQEEMNSHKSQSPALVENTVVMQQQEIVEQQESSVEIVHAQSMVEVVAPSSPTHEEPELEFVSHQPVEEAAPSPVYTPAPFNDLMSTSMILEQPISDAPEQVEEMMQFMTTNTQVYSMEEQQTAEVVHISERQATPESESANLLQVDESEHGYSPEQSSPAHIEAEHNILGPDTIPSPVQSDRIAESPMANETRSPVQSPMADEASSPVQSPMVDEARSPVQSPMADEARSPVQSPMADEARSPVQSPMVDEASSPVQSPMADEARSPVQSFVADEARSPMTDSNIEDSLVEQMNKANINDSHSPMCDEEQVVSPGTEPIREQTPVTEDVNVEEVHPQEFSAPSPQQLIDEPCEELDQLASSEACSDAPVSPVRMEETASPVQLIQTPVSDVMPSTPMREPMINDRPISPIHTPKADVPVFDAEVISEIAPPVTPADGDKKAPVKPAPRSTATGARPTARSLAGTMKTPTTTNVKPGTPRPSARTTPGSRPTPGSAVRSTATTSTATRTTPTSRVTPTTRTPLSLRNTTSSRPTSACSTSTTRTTTRTPLSSRTTTPSATRTTPSSSTTRPTPSSSAKPTPATRTTRPATTPSTLRTTPASTTTRTTPSSRPTSATTTPTTTRRAPISRRTTTATASGKDSTDSKAPATTKASTAARVPLARKPLYPGSTKTTTAARSTTTTDKKDIKNSTNKMLSSRVTASSKVQSSTAPTHKPLASRTAAGLKKTTSTTAPTKSRTTTTTTRVGLKAKTATAVASKTEVITTTTTEEKKEVLTPETNGEVKIAQEENSIEVPAKQEEHINGDAIMDEVLINGDGPH